MEQKYNIGNKIFIIKNNEITEHEIKAITIQDDKIKYMFDKNSCGGWGENELFSTKPKAIIYYNMLLQQAKFKIGDFVLVLNVPYPNYQKSISEWNTKGIDIIKNVMVDNEQNIEYGLYNDYRDDDDDRYRYNLMSEKYLIKINKEPIGKLFDVKDLVIKLSNIKKQYNELNKELALKYTELEKQIGREFVKGDNKLFRSFGMTFYNKLFEQEK